MPRKTFTFEGRRYDVTAPTAEELAVKVAMRKRDLEEGKKKISKNMTVKAWSDEWLETYKRGTVGERTFANYREIQRKINDAIGSKALKDIKPLDCQKILNGLGGKSRSYLHKVELFLSSMFQKAVENGLLLENPAARLVLPACTDGTHRALTDGERALLLRVCDTHPAGLWVRIMLYCGLRPGETARIQGRHIDRETRRLSVDGTKTEAAVRIVPLPAAVGEIPHVGPFEYLFTGQTGRPLTKEVMRRMWKSVVREMNIEMGCKVYRNRVLPPYAVAADLVPYCLRHTYCTDLQAAGVPINVAKELMGHTDISTTARIYTHRSEAAFSAAAAAIEELHRGKGCGSGTGNR